MVSVLSVPADYGYVLATLTASVVINQWHGFFVGGARKAAKVPYPAAYASDAEAAADDAKHAFNCAQRAHANYLESLPTFLVASAIAGLEFPRATGAMGAVWCVMRVLYSLGYKNSPRGSGGTGRYRGILYMPVQMVLIGMAAWTGYSVVVA